MAGMNKSRSDVQRERTFEGAVAMKETPQNTLRRVLFAHMLFEDTFYIDGTTTANVLAGAVKRSADTDPLSTVAIIMSARKDHNIRHASLLAAVTYAKHVKGASAAALIYNVIQRADELAEVLAMAARPGSAGVPLKALGVPSAIRKGVARAFGKFDEYQFGKYSGKGKMLSLKDAVFVSHPSTEVQPLVEKIVNDTLAVPETWEVGLSGGGDKREVFEGLLRENKLGAMALLRNLRNMGQANVSRALIADAFGRANWSRVLPFRFMSAALNAPSFASHLDVAFKMAVAGSLHLKGRTAVLLDTSGSMSSPISKRSEVRSYQAGATLAAAINGDHVDLYQWANHTEMMPNWNSLSSAMGIRTGKVGWGTNLNQAIAHVNAHGEYDRLIVITDLQFNDDKLIGLKPDQIGYTINTVPYKGAGLVHGRWTHLTGWSDAVLKFISVTEEGNA